jgi:hypothetical protein
MKRAPDEVTSPDVVMKRSLTRFCLPLAGLLLALVCLAWYASENFSGRLGAGVEHLGYAVIWPGHMVDALLSGNFHSGFGGWWSGGIRITASWLIWSSPLILLWFFSGRTKDNGTVRHIDS